MPCFKPVALIISFIREICEIYSPSTRNLPFSAPSHRLITRINIPVFLDNDRGRRKKEDRRGFDLRARSGTKLTRGRRQPSQESSQREDDRIREIETTGTKKFDRMVIRVLDCKSTDPEFLEISFRNQVFRDEVSWSILIREILGILLSSLGGSYFERGRKFIFNKEGNRKIDLILNFFHYNSSKKIVTKFFSRTFDQKLIRLIRNCVTKFLIKIRCLCDINISKFRLNGLRLIKKFLNERLLQIKRREEKGREEKRKFTENFIRYF